MTKIMIMLFVLCGTMMACIEDGALPPEGSPDAAPPTDEPDACPVTPSDASMPDAAPVSPDATTTPDATPVLPDASTPDACPTSDAPSQCTCDDDCNDSRSWTGDACSNGTCVHWVTDCGGMQVRPATDAATCEFWAGFGVPEPAPSLGLFSVSGLLTGPSGGSWKTAPLHACSVICYNPGLGEATSDIQIEWNGLTFQHQEITGLKKGTWDGQNLRY